MNPLTGRSRVRLRALIVEDDEDQRDMLDVVLAGFGCDVRCASDGEQALAMLAQEPAELVLTDWRMPRLDGLELTRIVRDRLRSSEYTYIVLMTASPDLDAVDEGLAAGADSFLRKPVDTAELRLSIEAARRILLLRSHLRRRDDKLRKAHDSVRTAYRQVRDDLSAAAEAQAELLPTRGDLCAGLACGWLYRPASQVGGDLIGLIPLGADRLFFYQLDVTGHGVRAALLASALHAELLHMSAADQPDPAQVLAAINRRLISRSEAASVTLVCGIACGASGQVRLARAGHPWPAVVGAAGARMVTGGGLPAGFFEHAAYTSEEITLAPGERLFLYSDGLADQLAGDADQGAALCRLFGAESTASLDACLARLDEKRTAMRDVDDASLLVIERTVEVTEGFA